MKTYYLSWAYGVGKKCQGGMKKDPSETEVLKALDDAFRLSGSVTLDLKLATEPGTTSLQVRTEGGNSVLTMLEREGGEVRSFSNGRKSARGPDILGDEWDASMICEEPELIQAVFNEFLKTGVVSWEVLN